MGLNYWSTFLADTNIIYQFVFQTLKYHKMEDTFHMTPFATLETIETCHLAVVYATVTAGDKRREAILPPVTIP